MSTAIATSASKAIATKTALINNRPFAIVPGETILQFVRRYKCKDYVPTLCDAPNL